MSAGVKTPQDIIGVVIRYEVLLKKPSRLAQTSLDLLPEMPTLTAYVANCLMGGAEVTHHPDGSWIRDVVRFKCDRWEFRFRQRPDIAQGKTEALKGTFCETTTVEVEGVHPTCRDMLTS